MNVPNLSKAEDVSAHILARWRAQSGRLVVSIDGRSGAGKTDFTATLENILMHSSPSPHPRVITIHLEQFYLGWSGLEAGIDQFQKHVLIPWRCGHTSQFREYDWEHHENGATITVPEADIMLVEGCGSGAQRIAGNVGFIVWMRAPTITRKRRALARDGATYRPWWDHWAQQEDAHFYTNRTRSRATCVIDTA